MEKDQKLAVINAKRGTLENEKYSAEIDLKLAKESDDENLAVEPQKRLDEIKAKLKVLADEEASLK